MRHGCTGGGATRDSFCTGTNEKESASHDPVSFCQRTSSLFFSRFFRTATPGLTSKKRNILLLALCHLGLRPVGCFTGDQVLSRRSNCHARDAPICPAGGGCCDLIVSAGGEEHSGGEIQHTRVERGSWSGALVVELISRRLVVRLMTDGRDFKPDVVPM